MSLMFYSLKQFSFIFVLYIVCAFCAFCTPFYFELWFGCAFFFLLLFSPVVYSTVHNFYVNFVLDSTLQYSSSKMFMAVNRVKFCMIQQSSRPNTFRTFTPTTFFHSLSSSCFINMIEEHFKLYSQKKKNCC